MSNEYGEDHRQRRGLRLLDTSLGIDRLSHSAFVHQTRKTSAVTSGKGKKRVAKVRGRDTHQVVSLMLSVREYSLFGDEYQHERRQYMFVASKRSSRFAAGVGRKIKGDSQFGQRITPSHEHATAVRVPSLECHPRATGR